MTTTIVTTAAVAFVVTLVLGFVLLPILRRLKFGQTIKEIGPTWHKNKQGTPTMGGIMFIIGILAACAVGYALFLSSAEYSIGAVNNSAYDLQFWAGIVFALLMGAVGFVDDYIKVVKKRNLGLSAKQKTLFQFLIIIGYMAALYFSGNTETSLAIPFTTAQLPLWYFYYPIVAVAIYFLVNAVNLTDGVDGLATSVTFVVALGFMVAFTMLSAGSGDTGRYQILSTALAAGCLGFFVWNVHPAKVFMGDTGSMFLGGVVVALGMGSGMPLILILFGIIYVIEALSVVLQVISFKLFGKRIFKMSPIHHHFEMCGWSEMKIVLVFSGVTLVASALAVLGMYNTFLAR